MQARCDKGAFEPPGHRWCEYSRVLTFLTVRDRFCMKFFSVPTDCWRRAEIAPMLVVALAGAIFVATSGGAQSAVSGKADAAAQAKALYAQGMSAVQRQ